MGGESSKEEHTKHGISPEFRQFIHGWQFFKTEREPTIGQVKVYKKPGDSNLRIYKKVIFDTEEDARDFIADLREVRQVLHTNVLPIIWSNCKHCIRY